MKELRGFLMICLELMMVDLNTKICQLIVFKRIYFGILYNLPQLLGPFLDGSSEEDEMADFIVEDVEADEHGGPSR